MTVRRDRQVSELAAIEDDEGLGVVARHVVAAVMEGARDRRSNDTIERIETPGFLVAKQTPGVGRQWLRGLQVAATSPCGNHRQPRRQRHAVLARAPCLAAIV